MAHGKVVFGAILVFAVAAQGFPRSPSTTDKPVTIVSHGASTAPVAIPSKPLLSPSAASATSDEFRSKRQCDHETSTDSNEEQGDDDDRRGLLNPNRPFVFNWPFLRTTTAAPQPPPAFSVAVAPPPNNADANAAKAAAEAATAAANAAAEAAKLATLALNEIVKQQKEKKLPQQQTPDELPTPKTPKNRN